MGSGYLSTEEDSWRMSRVRSEDTKPERLVRSSLHKMGLRFRLHRKDLPGTPDIVLPKYRTAIFVHGCFWHRHPNCKRTTTPKQNIELWRKKFERTILRDAQKIDDLKALGWNVVIIWECEITKSDELSNKLMAILNGTVK